MKGERVWQFTLMRLLINDS
ncbi:hypothetical protein Gorai_009621 [Gossypium raimondii]|uniref:Uncharacterized protein n=1 Tax=Gossypium raimondii TaxID=29730 RepID=A0A7J8PU43_GOSRA|nr:hypothetical protein [Gossypium raimondii]